MHELCEQEWHGTGEWRQAEPKLMSDINQTLACKHPLDSLVQETERVNKIQSVQ